MMLTKVSLLLLLGMFLFSTFSNESKPITPDIDYDLLIRNGLVVDGTGRSAYKGDLAIKGDRIVRIGNLKSATAKRVIDARGLVVAPGFIDMLGQSETYVLIPE